jgi:hypothetical protein
MFLLLLAVNFLISVGVCLIVARIFQSPISRILQRLIAEELYSTWSRYMTFAIYVVGISGGVRVWDLEKYITPRAQGGTILELTSDRWVLEVYRTMIDTLQSNAWMLLLFFLFTLIAFVITKGMELRKQTSQKG